MSKRPSRLPGRLLGLLGAITAACHAQETPTVTRPETAPTASITASAPVPPISKSALTAHVARLSAMNGRRSASPDEGVAAEYVASALRASGVAMVPGLTAHVQDFALDGATSRNVLAYIPANVEPATDVVVVGAHIDHLGTRGGVVYPGAEDNASGVAVLLEVARVLQADPRAKAGVILAFFGAEEIGLRGSARFVEAPPVPLDRIKLMVNIDMIGRPFVDLGEYRTLKRALLFDDRSAVGVVGTENRPRLKAAVLASCATEDVAPYAPEDLPEGEMRDQARRQANMRGDNASFERSGIPAVFFGSGESDDYHRPSDTADKVSAQIMLRRARVILDFVRRVCREGTASVR